MRSILSRLLAPLLLAGLASTAEAAPALWRISDDDSSVWLFGSIHALDGERDWRSPTFDTALAEAETVYFEILLDQDAYATFTRLTMTHGYNRDGRTLADYLTEGQRRAFDATVAELELDPATFAGMRPWLAELTLALNAAAGGAGPSMTAGIETLLQGEVGEDRERGLETPEMQFWLLAGGTDEQQVDGLMRTVAMVGAGGGDTALAQMVEVWLAGDTDTLHRMMIAGLGPVDGLPYQRLLTNRNAEWAEAMAGMLARNEDAMVIVGAGHLVGPDGVPDMLARRGFAVERATPGPRRNPGMLPQRSPAYERRR